MLDHPCRHTDRYRIGRYVTRNDRSGTYHGIVANGHALQDGGVGTHPDIFPQNNGRGIGHLALLRLQKMVERGKHYIVPYLASVPDTYATMVLEMAAGIDEHILTHLNVLPEIGIKRREHTERGGDGFSEKPGKDVPDFFRSMIGGVQPESDFPRLSAHFVHKLMYLFRVKRLASLHEILEFFECHNSLHLVYCPQRYGNMKGGKVNISPMFVPVLRKIRIPCKHIGKSMSRRFRKQVYHHDSAENHADADDGRHAQMLSGEAMELYHSDIMVIIKYPHHFPDYTMKPVCLFGNFSLTLRKEKEGTMERNMNLYQLSPEIADKQFKRIELFNRGRSRDNGIYAIRMATPFRPNYTLWRIFPQYAEPLFVRTLGVTFETAVDRVFSLLQNCNVWLDTADSSTFEPYYSEADEIIPFGKYKGKHLSEIFYIDPSYVYWLANKFTTDSRKYDRLISQAKCFSIVHFEFTVHKPRVASVSRFVRNVGDRLKDLQLTVLNVRLQVDTYKPDFYVDQNVLAADRDGNRFTFLIKAAARSLTPNALSCRSREIKRQEVLQVKSAKVMSHYESHGVRYTRLGYVRLL